MIDFKKMDEKEFVFVSKPLSEKEEKEFSDFLKARKTKTRQTRLTKNKGNFKNNSTAANKSIANRLADTAQHQQQ